MARVTAGQALGAIVYVTGNTAPLARHPAEAFSQLVRLRTHTRARAGREARPRYRASRSFTVAGVARVTEIAGPSPDQTRSR